MLRRILAFAQITRPHNMVAASSCVVAGYYLSGGAFSGEVLSPIVFTGLIVGCGNMVNDYFDVDTDRINKPRRPIPSGVLSKGLVLKTYVLLSFILSVLVLTMFSRAVALFLISWEVLIFLYACKLKRIPLAGNLLVALVAASAFPFGALLSGGLGASYFPFLFAFLFVLGRELVKGGEDLEGDKASGALTLAVKLGKEVTLPIAAFLLILCVIIAPLPTMLHSYGRVYFFIMESAVVPGLLITSYILLGNPDKRVLARASWLLKGEMFMGILAMAFSKAI